MNTTNLRPLLVDALRAKVRDESNVAILYSGGFESFSCLAICLELGLKPSLYTFYLEGIESHDIVKARNDANAFGVTLHEIVVPSDKEKLKEDVFAIVDKFKTTRKTVVQCLHPLLYTIPRIEEKYVVVGLERGRPWGLNKRGSMAARKGDEEFNAYRRYAIDEQASNSIYYIENFINEEHICVRPYDDDSVDAWFMARTYWELNQPHAKQPILDEFKKEIDFCGMSPRHASYQVESKIREFHNTLLDDEELNPNGRYVNVVGVYNNIKKILEDKDKTLF